MIWFLFHFFKSTIKTIKWHFNSFTSASISLHRMFFLWNNWNYTFPFIVKNRKATLHKPLQLSWHWNKFVFQLIKKKKKKNRIEIKLKVIFYEEEWKIQIWKTCWMGEGKVKKKKRKRKKEKKRVISDIREIKNISSESIGR